jgi:Cu(I)/Ag(I) efflux system membrane fusion protein
MTNNETSAQTEPAKSATRFTWGAVIALCLCCSLLAGALGYFLALQHGKGASAEHQAAAEMYQCPMHPTVIQDHPGDCPICGMKLVKVATPTAAIGQHPSATPGATAERRLLFYRSPMDPKRTSPTPRKDEMGMEYLPVYEDETAHAAPPVAGLATIDIDPSRQQLIGLRTVEVTRTKLGGARRTVGRVVVDETRVAHVNLKVAGFVERIYVDFIGKQVQRGSPLFTLYSPELLAAQDEYLLALRARGVLGSANISPSGENDTLVNAARRKLELWDVPAKTIDQIEQTRQTVKTVTFYSPVSGVVTKKDVVRGMKLDAGAMPYEIVDLSQVWVVADVYESEIRFVKEGMPATLTLNAFPNREFAGKTVFIDPMLDPISRTVKVRVTFPNPTKELKPEMFGEVVLKGSPHEALTIPEDAVINSGTGHVVFVAINDGKFQPRLVQLGDTDGNQVEIVSGLTLGERVVTRANFLIDSESRLRASLAELAGGPQLQPESARVLPATAGSAAAPSQSEQPRGPAAPVPTKPPVTPERDSHEHHGSHPDHGAHTP